MGEMAEMLLDGTCCECCGEYLGDGPTGYPRYCSKQCATGRGAPWHDPLPAPKIRKTKCPECGRKVKIAGLKDHLRAMHGAQQ
jgi:endogenous inhibitor of DNA gyrase (YacG/DUF329 family)